jgi:ATP phosphoribosyltransferase
MSVRERLRIAVQKGGRLAEPSLGLLAQCGFRFRQSRDRLFCFGESAPVDLLLVRDDDIPRLIAEGTCDLGIVGRNVLAEAGAAVAELRPLGFGACRLSIAVPAAETYDGVASLAGRRIATSHPRLLERWLADEGVDATVVVLNGSVEIAPRLGTADAICDLVSSGATLAANQLREAATVMESEAVLAGIPGAGGVARADLQAMLLRRLDSALAVKDTKLVMLSARRESWPAIRSLLPGHARASVMTLEGAPEEVAVQALCTGAVTWQHLEEMKRAGAVGLLVLPVEKMLA